MPCVIHSLLIVSSILHPVSSIPFPVSLFILPFFDFVYCVATCDIAE